MTTSMTTLRLRSILIALAALAALMVPALRAEAKKCDSPFHNSAAIYKFLVKVDGVEVGQDDPAALAWSSRGYVFVARIEESEDSVDASEAWELFDIPQEGDHFEALGPVEAE